jgi:hypothetical protein
MNLTARRDPKDLQAAWASKATAQMKMLMLIVPMSIFLPVSLDKEQRVPHPFSNGKLLQSQILRVLTK